MQHSSGSAVFGTAGGKVLPHGATSRVGSQMQPGQWQQPILPPTPRSISGAFGAARSSVNGRLLATHSSHNLAAPSPSRHQHHDHRQRWQPKEVSMGASRGSDPLESLDNIRAGRALQQTLWDDVKYLPALRDAERANQERQNAVRHILPILKCNHASATVLGAFCALACCCYRLITEHITPGQLSVLWTIEISARACLKH